MTDRATRFRHRGPLVTASLVATLVLFSTPATADNLTMSNPTPIQSAAVDAGTSGVVMLRFQVDSDSAGDGSLELSGVTVDDLGTAGAGDWSSLQIYIDTDTNFAGSTLIGTQNSWDGTSTTVTLDQGTAGDRTVTSGTSKYVFVVYNLTEAAEGASLQARVTAVDVAGIDNGETGLTYDSSSVTVNADTLTASGNTPVQTADPTAGQADVVMQYFQVASNTAGNNSIALTSMTVDDLGTASAGDWDNLEIYIDTDTTFAGSTLIGAVAGWNGTSTAVTLDQGTPGDRTVTAGTPKYVFVVYDVNAGAAGSTLLNRVTAVGVAAPDTGHPGLAFDSNSLTVQAAGETTTVGDNLGSEPAGLGRCPGADTGNRATLDNFTLVTSAGTDDVTEVQVDFGVGTVAGLSLAEITSNGGGQVYGSQADPGDPQTIAISPTPIPVTITPGDGQIELNWTNPGDADFAEVVILRNTASITDVPAEGQTYTSGQFVPPGNSEVVYTGNLQTFTDTGVVNGTDYWYETFARDACVNYAPGAQTGPHIPQAANNQVVPDPAAAAVDGCDQITVTATFTGDDNADSNTTFRRGSSATGPWVNVCTAVSGASPRTCLDSGVSESSQVWYQVEFTDAVDGVDTTNAPNPQVIGPYLTPACAADDTTRTSDSVEFGSCNQVTVTAMFDGDDDDDGSTLVQYSDTSATGPWTTACAELTGPSPRLCIIPALTGGTQYWVQTTYSDPDGVTPPASNVPPPVTLPACNDTDDVPPTVMIVAPARNAVVSGVDRVKAQVYDSGGLAATAPVQWSINGGGLSTATVNTNYSCGDSCAVYEFDLDTTGLANDIHYLTIEATDAQTPANVARVSQAFRSSNRAGQPGGSGQLLRRTGGSQICADCHNLPSHTSQSTSTKYGNWTNDCLTCHTPHRTTNIYLIGEVVRTPNSGKQTVQFHFDDRAGSTNPGSAPGNYSYLGDRSGADNAPYNDGVCETCHTRTKYHRNDTSGNNNHAHNASQRCVDCHTHEGGFFGGGGGCLGCHANDGDAGTIGPNNRRAVAADFNNNSHHVGAGTTYMGGNLTDFDCVVCHAEGTINAQDETETTTWHNDGQGAGGNNRIDLKDADNTSNVFNYDKDLVASSAGAAANWFSANSDWRTQMSTALDPFCLSCHDANGADQSFASNDGGSASNPFGDLAITNDYDRLDRQVVVDVASMVVGNPPPDGQYARHAIRGQSPSHNTVYQNIPDDGNGPYTSMYEAGVLTNGGATPAGEGPLWNDTSVMGCADCHTVDGANGTAGNAHGANTEYLLKNADGTSGAEGTYADGTYICFKCHPSGTYDEAHTDGNSSDFLHTANFDGTGRTDRGANSGGSFTGIACVNCHGGAPGDKGTAGSPTTPEAYARGFGRIHGTSSIFYVGGPGTGERLSYRFTNGGSLRFFDPTTWYATGRNSMTCYTLGDAAAPKDDWGGCVQHDGGRGGERQIPRPVTY